MNVSRMSGKSWETINTLLYKILVKKEILRDLETKNFETEHRNDF